MKNLLLLSCQKIRKKTLLLFKSFDMKVGCRIIPGCVCHFVTRRATCLTPDTIDNYFLIYFRENSLMRSESKGRLTSKGRGKNAAVFSSFILKNKTVSTYDSCIISYQSFDSTNRDIFFSFQRLRIFSSMVSVCRHPNSNNPMAFFQISDARKCIYFRGENFQIVVCFEKRRGNERK